MNSCGAEPAIRWMLEDMGPGHPRELARKSVQLFKTLVPIAVMGDSVAQWPVDGVSGKVRIKRADAIANQVHVWHGEPIAVHVPNEGADEWYVLPVSWQLKFARAHAKTAKQHASHAFDCMMIARDELPSSFCVAFPPTDLQKACETAMLDARRKEIRFMVKAVSRLRDAVADVLIDTFEEEFGDQ